MECSCKIKNILLKKILLKKRVIRIHEIPDYYDFNFKSDLICGIY